MIVGQNFTYGFKAAGNVDSLKLHTEFETIVLDLQKDTAETKMGLSVGYNFSYNYCCAWWIKGTLGTGTSSNKTVDSTGTEELKYGYSYYALTVGKRFSIELFGLKNFSYSPAITMTSAKMTGSTHSDGLNSASELKLDILRLDILF